MTHDLPRIDNEPLDDFARRVVTDMSAQVTKADVQRAVAYAKRSMVAFSTAPPNWSRRATSW